MQIPPNIMMGMEIELRCQISARSITARSSQPRQSVGTICLSAATHSFETFCCAATAVIARHGLRHEKARAALPLQAGL